MPSSTYLVAGLVAMLSSATMVSAVCSANGTSAVAIGTSSANTATGLTSYKIYDSSCNTKQSLSVATTPGVCDSQYFMCAFGTKTIQEYDDPTTGRSYICTADTTTESCGTDAVTFCCTFGLIYG